MPDEKKRSGVKVCGWLSDEVFSELAKKGYKSHTIIVRHGAELILGQTIGEHGELTEGTIEGLIENTREQTENIREQIENDGELRELRVQVREQREHIETLKEQLEQVHKDKERIEDQAAIDKERLNDNFTNHLKQVQTLINQLNDTKKQIEAPKRVWWKFW